MQRRRRECPTCSTMGSGGNPMGMYSRGKKDTIFYNMSTMEIGSLWESKTYIENPDSPLNCKYVCRDWWRKFATGVKKMHKYGYNSILFNFLTRYGYN